MLCNVGKTERECIILKICLHLLENEQCFEFAVNGNSEGLWSDQWPPERAING